MGVGTMSMGTLKAPDTPTSEMLGALGLGLSSLARGQQGRNKKGERNAQACVGGRNIVTPISGALSGFGLGLSSITSGQESAAPDQTRIPAELFHSAGSLRGRMSKRRLT